MPYFFHDACFAFREGDVSTRLVLNELDVNLSSFATGLIVIVVIIVASGCADTRAFNTTVFTGDAITIARCERIVAC